MELLMDGWNHVILIGISKAKAAFWTLTDIDERKLREQRRLDTFVVLAVNNEYFFFNNLFGGFKKNKLT